MLSRKLKDHLRAAICRRIASNLHSPLTGAAQMMEFRSWSEAMEDKHQQRRGLLSPPPFEFQTSLQRSSSGGACRPTPQWPAASLHAYFFMIMHTSGWLFGCLSWPRRRKIPPNLQAVEWITDSLSTAPDGDGGPPLAPHFHCVTVCVCVSSADLFLHSATFAKSRSEMISY